MICVGVHIDQHVKSWWRILIFSTDALGYSNVLCWPWHHTKNAVTLSACKHQWNSISCSHTPEVWGLLIHLRCWLQHTFGRGNSAPKWYLLTSTDIDIEEGLKSGWSFHCRVIHSGTLWPAHVTYTPWYPVSCRGPTQHLCFEHSIWCLHDNICWDTLETAWHSPASFS